MPHLDDGQLNALLDGELDPAATQAAQSHLAACAECAGRLEEARHFLTRAADLLGALDLGAPPQAVAPGAAAAAPSPPPAVPRRVSTTAKEVALDLEAATQKSPALPGEPWRESEDERGVGVFARRLAPPPSRARGMDISTLAWAATIVLAIGLGFLANEVRHARQGIALSGSPPSPPTAPSPAASAAQGTGSGDQGAQTAATGGKGDATRATRSATGASRQAGPSARGAARAPARKQLERRAETQRADTGVAAAKAERPELAAAERVGQRPVTAAPEVSPRAGAAPSGNVGGIEAARGGFAQAPGPEPLTSFRRVTLEEAVSRLRGAIRLVDGMQIDRVEAGPGYLASGAARNRDLVRILYRDAEGRRLQLDEQRLDLAPDSGGNELREEDALVGLRPGEPLTTAAPGGQVRVRWVDAGGFWLSLTAALSPDSLRRLVSRVR